MLLGILAGTALTVFLDHRLLLTQKKFIVTEKLKVKENPCQMELYISHGFEEGYLEGWRGRLTQHTPVPSGRRFKTSKPSFLTLNLNYVVPF